MSRKELLGTLWLLLISVVLAIPVVLWGNGLHWELGRVTLYAFFPLLGLLAFSLMWLQISALTLKSFVTQEDLATDTFLKKSGIFVLLLIIFHPVLLGVAMAQVGAGLPLQSLYQYVPPKQTIFITYALIAWSIFIMSEITSRLQKVSWIKRGGKVIEYLNYAGFFLIFWHSIHIGSNLQSGFARGLWWVYAVTALVGLVLVGVRGRSTT